jgi:hypothetical protein
MTFRCPRSRLRRSGLPPLIGLVGCFDQSQSGDGLMNRNVFALIGAVALLLSATVALTFSRATPSASGIGTLKCYGVTVEKPCDRPPQIVRPSVRDARLN